MAKPKTPKNEDAATKDPAAEADRERQLRDMIERAEDKKSGTKPPEKESPHDFVERKSRDKPDD
ncbi:hypothetical protein [Bradyrhizobium ottawaense]|uniref:hypothetical protein n=1 Tax=Bradyrhizobium ottawaense TaxID=931866 RepID=UPI001177442D|nr:hypothetical protein [Bradyrhizobium ottawaense]